MTVVDLTGKGDLWIHSPIGLNPSLVAELQKLGTVKYVIAPNCWHHFFVADFQSHFPDAQFGCAPGLETKRKDLAFNDVLEDGVIYPWSSALSHRVVQGCPQLNEVVFYHPESKTLIVTDLGLHICDDSPWVTRFAFRLMGTYRKFGWTAMEKRLLIRNKSLFYKSIASIQAWDFQKIILAHGQLISKDGTSLFQRAWGSIKP